MTVLYRLGYLAPPDAEISVLVCQSDLLTYLPHQRIHCHSGQSGKAGDPTSPIGNDVLLARNRWDVEGEIGNKEKKGEVLCVCGASK